jgi:D-glycero-D-manno-heptose 1,7-bisphosphate phosphatase
MSRAAVSTVFIDRDGVVNRLRPGDYVKTWTEFEFLPGSLDALRLLTESGYRVIVVTNQRGVSRGLMTEQDLIDIHTRMIDSVAAAGASIAAIYSCPHAAGECTCRKPQTGLFLQAQRDFPDIVFSRCTMIGDSLTDMEAGSRVGCRTIFVGEDRRYRCAPSLQAAVVKYLVGRPLVDASAPAAVTPRSV